MTGYANKLKTPTTRLESIANKIHQLRQNILSYQHKSQHIKNNLEESEKSIGVIAKQLRITQHKIATQKILLTKNRFKQSENRLLLQRQKQLLVKQIHALYLLGREPYLKIILNQEDPIKISRYLHYYAYLSVARQQLIQTIKSTTDTLANTEIEMRDQTLQLEKTQAQQKKQHVAILSEEHHRKTLLQKTKTALQTQQTKLNQLLANKKHLETIVDEINQEKSFNYSPGESFQQMRGHLLWPIKPAHILQAFGSSIAGGRLSSTGVLLSANMGEPIRAIFPGKVVFANWLNGFGLLVIIQHGPNYMTLYGRNQSLYVKLGETVTAGQMIATAGNSGGFQTPSLYFEVRYKGKPLNPKNWMA